MSGFVAVLEYLRALLAGVPVTLMLALTSLAIGFLLAVLLAMARLSSIRTLSMFAYGYVYVIRATPMILQLMFIYYGLGQIDGVRESVLWSFFKNPYACAILALAMNTAGYTSEIIRSALLSVPSGQIEAAQAFGMSRGIYMRHVVAPLALRQILPSYSNEVAIMVKSTAVASVITIMDITGIARELAAQTYAPVMIFSFAGLIYLTMNALIISSFRYWEGRLARTGAQAR